MDVIFIQAPSPGVHNKRATHKFATPPLGLGYLASICLQLDYSAAIRDLEREDLDANALFMYLQQVRPRLVCISCVTLSYKNALKVARIAKRAVPDCLVIMGGPHVTYTARETVAHEEAVDCVGIGEGELIVRELAERWIGGSGDWKATSGIAFRVDSTSDRLGSELSGVGGTLEVDGVPTHVNPPQPWIKDLDALPFPAWHLMPLHLYGLPGVIMSTRGCPFKCNFCAESESGIGYQIRKGYRVRSSDNVLQEMRILYEVFGLTSFFFADDTFTLRKNRTFELCEQLKDLQRDISAQTDRRLKWTCESRVDMVNEELLAAMAASGCTTIQYGLESGSQRILDAIKKNTTLDQMRDAVRWAVKYDIKPVCSLLFPNPDDTPETLEETKSFMAEMKDLGVDKFIPSLATPFPGTELWNDADRLGLTFLTRDLNQYNLNTPIITTRHFDEEGVRRGYQGLVQLALSFNSVDEDWEVPLKDPKEFLLQNGVELMRAGQIV